MTSGEWVEVLAQCTVGALVCCLLYFGVQMLTIWRRLREIEREEEEGWR